MSCFCYICSNSNQIESHIDFVRSEFTEKSCVGNLSIGSYTISIPETYLSFRLNRSMSLKDCETELIFPTWTIEDCLFIEIHAPDRLLGLGKLFLARCSLPGQQEVTDVEWYTDITAQVSVRLQYYAFESKKYNAFVIYRQSLIGENTEKYTLISRIAGNDTQIKLKDASLGFREEYWQYVGTFEAEQEVECLLVAEKNSTSLMLPKANIPKRCTIQTPDYDGNFLCLYVIPYFSQYLVDSSTTIFFQMSLSNNIWISSLQENTIFSVSLKSPLFSEGIQNEVSILVTELTDIFEHQFVSYSADDKLVFKCLEDDRLINVGILKLIDLPSIELNKAYATSAQIAYNSCQFWLTVQSRQRDAREIKKEGNEKNLERNTKLTYKDPVFLDILELMEHKINRIKHKNSLINTQIQKVNSKNEILKKRINELERAPGISDYKAASTNRPKPKQENTIKKEMTEGICGCGRPNPKFKGYCEECVKTIKISYEKLLNWFTPIEKKHKELEDKFIGINGRKILLETKVKRLEERISKPIEFDEDSGIESAAELMMNLHKIQEEIKNLEEDAENSTNIYSKQQQDLQKELDKRKAEEEFQKKEVVKLTKEINETENKVANANERMVFKQYFNEKYKK